jgi:hypothetical protein
MVASLPDLGQTKRYPSLCSHVRVTWWHKLGFRLRYLLPHKSKLHIQSFQRTAPFVLCDCPICMNQVTIEITVLVFCLFPLQEPRKAVFSLILVRGMSCRHARTIPVPRNSDTNMSRWISGYITIEHITSVSPSVKTTETNDWLMLSLFEK